MTIDCKLTDDERCALLEAQAAERAHRRKEEMDAMLGHPKYMIVSHWSPLMVAIERIAALRGYPGAQVFWPLDPAPYDFQIVVEDVLDYQI